MWTLHKPSECKLKQEDQGEEKRDNTSTSYGEMMAAILEDIEEEENDEEGDSEWFLAHGNMYMHLLQMMYRFITYFHVIVPVAVPIFWIEWGTCVILTIMTTS